MSSLGFAVKLDKGDFIGREALKRQKADGLTRKLCCLTLSNNRVIALGKELIREEGGPQRDVGWVSSGGFGYSVGRASSMPTCLWNVPGWALT
jgi:glycine cleavage system aminomethyltransferase T